jgi:hypothetical protein
MERGQGSTGRGSRLREGGDIYSPEGQQSTAAGSQQGHCGSGSQQHHSGAGSQQGHVGDDVNQQHQGCHQFQYFFIKFLQLFLHMFFLIYEIIYILMQRLKMFEPVVKKDAGQRATLKKKAVNLAQLIRLRLLIYHGKRTWRNAPYKGVKAFMQNCKEISRICLYLLRVDKA